MFTAKVFRIMVGSLSGAMEEVYVAKETIRKWNQQNAERTGKIFMPIEWGASQEAIHNTDIVVGLVDNWIDDTKFVDDCVEVGKRVILLFKSISDPMNTISCELDCVKTFRERFQVRSSCDSYTRMTDFVTLINRQLDAF